jgi:hypothetical protein
VPAHGETARFRLCCSVFVRPVSRSSIARRSLAVVDLSVSHENRGVLMIAE